MNKLFFLSILILSLTHSVGSTASAQTESDQFDGSVLFLMTSWYELGSEKRSRLMYPILVSKENGFADFLEVESSSKKLLKLLTKAKREGYRIEEDISACSDIPLFIERPDDAKGVLDASIVLKGKTKHSLRQIPHSSSQVQIPRGQLSECPPGKKLGSYDYDRDGSLECIVLSGDFRTNQPKNLVVKNSKTSSEYLNITLSKEESVLGIKDIDSDKIPEILIMTQNYSKGDFGIEVYKSNFGYFNSVFKKSSYGCK